MEQRILEQFLNSHTFSLTHWKRKKKQSFAFETDVKWFGLNVEYSICGLSSGTWYTPLIFRKNEIKRQCDDFATQIEWNFFSNVTNNFRRMFNVSCFDRFVELWAEVSLIKHLINISTSYEDIHFLSTKREAKIRLRYANNQVWCDLIR